MNEKSFEKMPSAPQVSKTALCDAELDGLIARGEARSSFSGQQARPSPSVVEFFLLLKGELLLCFPKALEYERRLGACMGGASGGATTDRRRRSNAGSIVGLAGPAIRTDSGEADGDIESKLESLLVMGLHAPRRAPG